MLLEASEVISVNLTIPKRQASDKYCSEIGCVEGMLGGQRRNMVHQLVFGAIG